MSFSRSDPHMASAESFIVNVVASFSGCALTVEWCDRANIVLALIERSTVIILVK